MKYKGIIIILALLAFHPVFSQGPPPPPPGDGGGGSNCTSASLSQVNGTNTCDLPRLLVYPPDGCIFSYNLYRNGIPVANQTGGAVYFNISSNGSYYVHAMHSNGTSFNTNTVNVTSIEEPLIKPVLNQTGEKLLCQGQTINISVQNSRTGVVYNLFRNGSSIKSITATGTTLSFGNYGQEGQYYVQAFKSDLTCSSKTSNSDAFSIKLRPIITIPISVSNTAPCKGDEVILETSAWAPDYFLMESGRQIAQSKVGMFKVYTNGRYTIEIASSDGCNYRSSSDPAVLNFSDPTTMTLVLDYNSIVCRSGKITVTANVTYGGPSPDFNWSINGMPSHNKNSVLEISNLAGYGESVEIECKVNNSSGKCAGPVSLTRGASIKVIDEIKRDKEIVNLDDVSRCGTVNGSIKVLNTRLNAHYQLFYNNNLAETIIGNGVAISFNLRGEGDYKVILTDSNGCYANQLYHTSFGVWQIGEIIGDRIICSNEFISDFSISSASIVGSSIIWNYSENNQDWEVVGKGNSLRRYFEKDFYLQAYIEDCPATKTEKIFVRVGGKVHINEPFYYKADNKLYLNNYNEDFDFYWQVDENTFVETNNAKVINNPSGKYYLRAKNKKINCWANNYVMIDLTERPYSYLPQQTGVAITESSANYIKRFAFLQEYNGSNMAEADLEILAKAQNSPLLMNTTFVDGRGNEFMEVGKTASPSRFDVVSVTDYDFYGRMRKSMLPFLDQQDANYKNDFYNKHYQFYNSTSALNKQSQYAFSLVENENGSFSSSQYSFAPGEDWLGSKGKKSNRGTYSKNSYNSIFDQIFKIDFKYSFVSNGVPPADISFYKSGDLDATRSIDENGNLILTFTNSRGNVVSKKVMIDINQSLGIPIYMETVYLYDQFNNLSLVLPPNATELLRSNGNLNAKELRELAFIYKYDQRQRLVEKQVPGADWLFMVYDNRDRLVLTQDGNQRDNINSSGREWNFVKYDQLNRPVATGIYTHSAVVNQAQMQAIINNYYGTNNSISWFEIRGTSVHGYTDQSFPIGVSENNYLTVNYYDDYSFKTLTDFGAGFDFDPTQLSSQATPRGTYTFPGKEFERVKSLVTGSKVKVLDGNNTWISTVSYYDDKYRPIQIVTKNHNGKLDRFSTLYNVPGWVLSTCSQYDRDGTIFSFKKRYTYDHSGRLMKGFHELTENGKSQGEVLLAENKYNELGELVEKNLHVEDNVAKQSIDYRYNIRGWLKSINNSTLQLEAGRNENDIIADYFGMELIYNDPLK